MNITDSTLNELLKALSPRERDIISESTRQCREWPDDAKAILRWLKRRLKRRTRAGKRAVGSARSAGDQRDGATDLAQPRAQKASVNRVNREKSA